MRSSIALLAASALGALAQESTSTTSLFIGGRAAAGQSYAGSVVSVGPSETIYEIECTATEACGTLPVAVSTQQSNSLTMVYNELIHDYS